MKKEVRAVSKKKSITRRKSNPSDLKKSILYERDFVRWIAQQATLLKKGEFEKLDTKNLVEEIESLGKSDRRSLSSHILVILTHLLKQKYQPEKKGNSNSWQSSIFNARNEIQLLIDDSPSLKRELPKILPKAYAVARKKAAFETKLKIDVFPEECPWEIEDLIDQD